MDLFFLFVVGGVVEDAAALVGGVQQLGVRVRRVSQVVQMHNFVRKLLVGHGRLPDFILGAVSVGEVGGELDVLGLRLVVVHVDVLADRVLALQVQIHCLHSCRQERPRSGSIVLRSIRQTLRIAVDIGEVLEVVREVMVAVEHGGVEVMVVVGGPIILQVHILSHRLPMLFGWQLGSFRGED
eukprot:CAMPEP_0170542392 /NCGR_PEP_ID=MMETSP0211-20121228/1830_1 /TAXON_ID=311385 /ORGANISM="Pseudokeronopsis sp., Strain OXSARD2" /LENGTH=182 /DNA_ID=CAMNT_0010845433 /DNA_START=1574 /DNA_END=2122 /DNA_ORIENTATION=+